MLRTDRQEVRERLTGGMPRMKAVLGENLRIEIRGVRQERERE